MKTYRQRVAAEHPAAINRLEPGGVMGCPYDYGYEKNLDSCTARGVSPGELYMGGMDKLCRKCWDREMNKEERT